MGLTIVEVIEKYYDKDKDYIGLIREEYKGETGIGLQDSRDLITAFELVRDGDYYFAEDYLFNRDTAVRTTFVNILKDDPKYDWYGNRK